MSIKKYTDWKGYWLGLRQNLIKCIGTTGTAWGSTCLAAGAGMPVQAIDWKQAASMFGIHCAIEIFAYLKAQQPLVVEVNEDTVQITKP